MDDFCAEVRYSYFIVLRLISHWHWSGVTGLSFVECFQQCGHLLFSFFGRRLLQYAHHIGCPWIPALSGGQVLGDVFVVFCILHSPSVCDPFGCMEHLFVGVVVLQSLAVCDPYGCIGHLFLHSC